MTKTVFILVTVVLFAFSVYSAKKKVLSAKITQEKPDSSPKLYNYQKDSFQEIENSSTLGNRVYAVFVPGEKTWLFALTNSNGKFTEPAEFLYKGTVLMGKDIGAKNPYQRYLLDDDFNWIPSSKEPEKFLIQMTVQPRFKHEMRVAVKGK